MKKLSLISIALSCILSCLFSLDIYTQNFDSLQKIIEYASLYKEDIQSDNNDWIDPEFRTHFKNSTPSLFGKILSKIGLLKLQTFDTYAFEKLLKKITAERIKRQLKTPPTKTMEPQEGDRFIIFGDLHGAFHSMARNLRRLKELNYIDDTLTIVKKNIYLVIIGDAISRSPYSLELLHILLVLMEKNPTNVIYLQGNHEKDAYWENFSMARELKVKAAHASKHNISKIPFKDEINAFFNTLSNTLLITYKTQKVFINLGEMVQDLPADPTIAMVIVGEQRMENMKESPGLEFMGYQEGAAKWSALSCPTTTYKSFFNFYFDAFTELSIGQSIGQSILTLHNNDTRTKQINYKQTHYDPLFAFELPDKKPISQTKHIVKVGSSMYLTGVYWDLGKEIKAGIETALIAHNKKLQNTLIRPVILDDGYEPRIALANIHTLHDIYGIDKLLMPTGTATLAIYLDMILSNKLAAFFPASGSPRFRSSDIKNIVNLRPNYTTEAKNLIHFLTKEYGMKRFAFFYQMYGKDVVDELHKELQENGITNWLDLPHIVAQSNFHHLISKIREFSPEAIGCYTSQFPLQQLISELGTEYFLKHYMFMPSTLYTRNFTKYLESRGINFIISSVVPDPKQIELTIAQEHCTHMADRGLIPTIHSFMGYIAGSLFADATVKVKKPITKEKLIAYFENIKDYEYKGLHISFDPATKELIRDTWIRALNGNWIKINKDKVNP